MTTTQTIDDAQATLAVLNDRGWGQNGWCDRDRQFCLGGAMAYAITRGRDHSPSWLTQAELARFVALAEAMDLPTMNVGGATSYVITYNDEVAQTIHDVKAVLHDTIARLDPATQE